MTRDDHAGVRKRTAVALRGATLDHSDLMTLERTVVRHGKANDAATNDEHPLAHSERIPQQSGSASSKMNVASAVTYALPVM